MKWINMNKVLTKRQIKEFARIHSAVHLMAVDGNLFHEVGGISEYEKDEVVREIKAISDKMIKKDPSTFGSSGQILEYVKRNY